MKPPPEQSWQFRDQIIPARVWHLLKRGVKNGGITITDLLIIGIVDTLVRPQGEQSGRGCFASNSYLAEAVGVHPNYITERIRYLTDLGLMLDIRLGGKRYLEMEWSRTAEERIALEGDYGKACRKAHKKLLQILESQRDTKTPTGNPVGEGTGNPVGEGTGNPVHNRFVEDVRTRKTKRAAPPPVDGLGLDATPEDGDIRRKHKQAGLWAETLRAIVSATTNPKLRWNKVIAADWTAQCLRLRRDLGRIRLGKALDYLSRHIDWVREDIAQGHLPEIRQPRDLTRKRIDWILRRSKERLRTFVRRNGYDAELPNETEDDRKARRIAQMEREAEENKNIW